MITDEENNEWKAEAPYLASLQKENPFSVPAQYFDSLPDRIGSSLYVEQLKERLPVSGYTVPDQYFNNLQEQIFAASADAVLSALPKATGYQTPDQYFQKLQSKIQARILEEERVAPATVLPVTKEKSAEIFENSATKPAETKIVRLWHSGILKYASAACFIVATAFGLYLNQQSKTYVAPQMSSAEIANEQLLYDIDEQDIMDHVEGSIAGTQKNAPSAAEMETYILNNYSQTELSTSL